MTRSRLQNNTTGPTNTEVESFLEESETRGEESRYQEEKEHISFENPPILNNLVFILLSTAPQPELN